MFYIFTYSYKPPSTAAMVVAGRLPLKRQVGFLLGMMVLFFLETKKQILSVLSIYTCFCLPPLPILGDLTME